MRRPIQIALLLLIASSSGCSTGSDGRLRFDPWDSLASLIFPEPAVDPSKEPDGVIYKWKK